MNREILDAIEEQTGLHYDSLADAAGWYGTTTAWREDFTALWNPAPAGAIKQPLMAHKRRIKLMEHEVLDAIAEKFGERYKTIEAAQRDYSKGEMLGAWLQYTGGIGYTNLFWLLRVMEVIGYDVSADE